MLSTAHTVARKLTLLLEHVLAILLFAMFSTVLLLVILRYFLSTTIIGGNEATAVAFVFLTSIGAAVDIFRQRHIAITWFADKVSTERQPLIARVRLLLLALLNTVILIYSIVWIGRTGQFLMPALGVPQWVAQLCVPLCAGLSIFYCVIRIALPHQRNDAAEVEWQ